MIIKGASRSGPKQLARHLLKEDTNERVEVLENNNLFSLHEAFADWQNLTSLTRGKKGLYHANIDPAEGYTLTAEQWLRSVEVLEEQLGFQGQPRVIVLHEKKGRAHAHVVWQRTDLEREVLISDSQNYRAHERASARLEREFGHERVPGVHEKADFTKERPQQEVTHAEWQQAERTGLNPKERKALVTELYHAAGTGEVLRESLAEHGYVLAQGDRRALVIVDALGEVYSLARDIKGVKVKDIRERFPDLVPESLPTIEDAKAFQRDVAEKRALEAQEKAPSLDLSELIPEPERAQEPSPAQEFEPFEEKEMKKEKGREQERGLSEIFTEAALPESIPPDIRGDFAKATASPSEITAPPSAITEPPPEPTLSVAQQRDLADSEKRHEARVRGRQKTHAREQEKLRAEQAQSLADTLGVPPQELTGWLLAIEGSRFAPEVMLKAEQSRPKAEREQRREIAALVRKEHAVELEVLLDRQVQELQKLEQMREADLKRLSEQFERARQRADEAERIRQEKELERQEARERERPREDDFGHTQG